MGIASWLSKNTEGKSYIRRWLAQERDKADRDNTGVFALFTELIYTASRFGKCGSEEEHRRFQAEAKHYLGDATLFEIACYTYYQVEVWSANHEEGLKPKMADSIAFWIIEIFSVAWQKDEKAVGELFAERLDSYRSMAKNGNNIEVIHLELEQRILNTKGDRLGSGDQRKDRSSVEADHQFVQHSLELYAATQIPALMETIQDYCRNQSKQELRTKTPLRLEEQADQEKRDFLFAMALLEQRDFVKACRAFTRVIDSNPANYDALLRRGQLYFMLKQPLDAINDFSKAIDLNPGDARAYLQRGGCYHRALRMEDEALEDFSKAISLAPNDAAGYFERGSLLDEMALSIEKQALDANDQEEYLRVSQEFLAAIHDYGQAIALNPENDAAYVSRGLAYARKARAGKADFVLRSIDDLEKAISLNWENGYLYKTLDELKEVLEQKDSSQRGTLV